MSLTAPAPQTLAQETDSDAPVRGRAWQIEDSIGVTYFRESFDSPVDNFREGREGAWPAIISPDGDRFLIVTYQGHLLRDCVENRMLVYGTEDVAQSLHNGRAAPSPLAEVRLCSRGSTFSNRAINDVRWLDDERIIFRGIDEADGDAEDSIRGGAYLLSVSRNHLRRLTPRADAVRAFVTNGQTTLYARPGPPAASPPLYPATAITPSIFRELYYGQTARHSEIYLSRAGECPVLVDHGRIEIAATEPNAISPNGAWAVMIYNRDQPLPNAWSSYAWFAARRSAPATNRRTKSQFMLIDLSRSRARPVVDAPLGLFATETGAYDDHGGPGVGINPNGLWSADSRSLLLVNTALPITPDHPEHARQGYIASYDVSTGEIDILEAMTSLSPGDGQTRIVRDVRWLERGRRLLVEHVDETGAPAEASHYHYSAGRWRRETPTQVSGLEARDNGPGFALSIRQSANEPPVLTASAEGRQLQLLNPNPQLAEIALAQRQDVYWTDPDGRRVRGGLFLPTGEANTPPPLVIEAYYDRPSRFEPDGPFPTGNATQLLTARGFAVLTLDIPQTDHPELLVTPEENHSFVQRVDAAVQHLARVRLIDPTRVGLIGFSRAGYNVHYAITHPGRTRIGAAVINDSLGQSAFQEYLSSYALGENPEGTTGVDFYEGMMGGDPWRNPETWIAEAPTFNVDQVQGATLFLRTSNYAYVPREGFYEPLGAYRRNNKPVEFIFFPVSGHWLYAPAQRSASMIAVADWMSFWLQGQENPNPQFGERNARWRTMRHTAH